MKLKLLIISVVLFAFMLAGCNNNMAVYEGWWSFSNQMIGGTTIPPFQYAQINEDGTCTVYDEYGKVEQTGKFSLGILDRGFTLDDGNEYRLSRYKDEYGIRTIIIGNDYHYVYLEDEPSVISEGHQEPDPFEGSAGYWSLAFNQDYDSSYQADYLDVRDGYLICYDEAGNILEEGLMDYNEERGVNGLGFIKFGDYEITFGVYDDTGERYFNMYNIETEQGFKYISSEQLVFVDKTKYFGSWSAKTESCLPFTKIELLNKSIQNGDNAFGYDETGTKVFTGIFDVQLDLALPPIMMVTSDRMYAIELLEDGETIIVGDISNWETKEDFVEFYLEERYEASNDPAMSYEDAADVIFSTLGSKADNKALLDKGVEEINGANCRLITLGTNTPEKFTAEEHFAVAPNGHIYVMDIIAGGIWVDFSIEEKDDSEGVAMSYEDAADIIFNTLGSKVDNKALLDNDVEEINGVLCRLITVGTNTPEKFTAEEHFAVAPNGYIYVMDIIAGGVWVDYQP